MADTKIIASSYLKEDERLQDAPAVKKRIFSSDMYQIHLLVYAGHPKNAKFRNDMVAAQVEYKEENLQLLVRLATFPPSKNLDGHVEKVVKDLEHQGKSPLMVIRDAKKWCKIPLTSRDYAFFSKNGLVDRSAA